MDGAIRCQSYDVGLFDVGLSDLEPTPSNVRQVSIHRSVGAN
jgi:hypothetical protein